MDRHVWSQSQCITWLQVPVFAQVEEEQKYSSATTEIDSDMMNYINLLGS
jgi:hypothetical protein